MKNLKEKEIRNWVKKFLKQHLKGVSELLKIKIKVVNINPPKVYLELPFYSEGNLIRANEVDFLITEIEKEGVSIEIFYLDDFLEIENWCGYV